MQKNGFNDGDGLQDRGITRDLDWGIPVKRGQHEPWLGMQDKVFYVWFDAPIEYIASAQEWQDAGKGTNWERWWRIDKGAEDVIYTQFMGKHNVPFHTLSFPATILGSSETPETRRLHKIASTISIISGGQFSTSRGRGVFMDQALEILPSDYWRWWLLSNALESSDAEFTWELFQSNTNKDLADVLGNFVSRVTKFCRSKFGEIVPEGGGWGNQELTLIRELDQRLQVYQSLLEAMEVRKAAAEIRAIWVVGNEYLQAAAPWSTFKDDPEKQATIRPALNLIRLYAVLSSPFIPDACARILVAMKTDDSSWPKDCKSALNTLPAGHIFAVPEVTFRKITDDECEEWKTMFLPERAVNRLLGRPLITS